MTMQFADEINVEAWIEANEEQCVHGLSQYLCGGDADHYGDEVAFPLIEQRCATCGFTTTDNEAGYIHSQGDCGGDV